MIKLFFVFCISFFLWLFYVRLFSSKQESSINILLTKLFDNLNLIIINTIDLFYSVFNSLIQVYELIGSFLKGSVEVIKSVILTFMHMLKLSKLIGITLKSFFYLFLGLLNETIQTNPFNSLKILLVNTKSAKENFFNIFKENIKDKDEKILIR